MLLNLLLVERRTPMIQYDIMCRALKNSKNFSTFNNLLFALLLSSPEHHRGATLLSGSH